MGFRSDCYTPTGAAWPSTARWLFWHESDSAGPLAGMAQVTRSASAFGACRRRRRRTRVHAKAQLRLTRQPRPDRRRRGASRDWRFARRWSSCRQTRFAARPQLSLLVTWLQPFRRRHLGLALRADSRLACPVVQAKMESRLLSWRWLRLRCLARRVRIVGVSAGSDRCEGRSPHGPGTRNRGRHLPTSMQGCGVVAGIAQIGRTFNRPLTEAHWERYVCQMFVQGSSNQQIGRVEDGNGPEAGARAPKLLPPFVFVLSLGAGGR